MPDPTDPTTIGAALMFAVFMVREMFAYLKTRNGKSQPAETSAGDKSVEFWQQQNVLIISTAIRESVIPILSGQTAIMHELQVNQTDISQVLHRLEWLMEHPGPKSI